VARRHRRVGAWQPAGPRAGRGNQGAGAILAAANRAGFVTDFSQPGVDDKSGLVQRAAVYGFASAATFTALAAAAADTELIIAAARAGSAYRGTPIPVTRVNDRDCTRVGNVFSREEIADHYDCCSPAAVDVLSRAWQVTLIDPRWARNDHLWTVLRTLQRATAAQRIRRN
jgi:hypothetical protein